MSEAQQPTEWHEEKLPPAQHIGYPAPVDGLERPATVFLSYARQDVESVRALQIQLKLRGVVCWRDVDDLLAGSMFEGEIERAIEREADAIALYLTPACLKSDFIWTVEVPAALRRQARDPHFHIVPILQDVSLAEVRQHCLDHELADLSRFHAISLHDAGTVGAFEEVQQTKWHDAARRILQAALTLRMRRINADRDRSYEPSMCLKTFDWEFPTEHLDLNLDWRAFMGGKEQPSTPQEWEHILLPALLDVKQVLSAKAPGHRIHVFIKSILPAAIALGFAFRKTTGITLLLEGQKEIWSIEARPSKKDPLRAEWIGANQGDLREAVVEVATTRSIKQTVADAVPMLGLKPGHHVCLELPTLSREAVRNAAHAQAIAQQVGRVCQELCDQRRVTHIHLFVATPVELAVLIGQQLNALCPITLYEYGAQNVYKPVGTLVSK